MNDAEVGQFKFLELPYIGGDCSMYILLPKEIIPAAKLVESLSSEKILGLKGSASMHLVDTWLPKFELESHPAMKPALMGMGVSAAFDKRQADFDRMMHTKAEAFQVYISGIYHEAWIEVHEEGTEAAAATTGEDFSLGCSLPARPLPAEFHADHLFVFLIVHNESRSILFAGWMSNPAQAAQTQKKLQQ